MANKLLIAIKHEIEYFLENNDYEKFRKRYRSYCRKGN